MLAFSIRRIAWTYVPKDELSIASTGALSTAIMSLTSSGRRSDTAIAVFAPLKEELVKKTELQVHLEATGTSTCFVDDYHT